MQILAGFIGNSAIRVPRDAKPYQKRSIWATCTRLGIAIPAKSARRSMWRSSRSASQSGRASVRGYQAVVLLPVPVVGVVMGLFTLDAGLGLKAILS